MSSRAQFIVRSLVYLIALTYGYGGLVHIANIAGLSGYAWVDAPLKWQLLDVVYLSLDTVVFCWAAALMAHSHCRVLCSELLSNCPLHCRRSVDNGSACGVSAYSRARNVVEFFGWLPPRCSRHDGDLSKTAKPRDA